MFGIRSTPGWSGAWGSLGLRWQRTLTQGSEDLFGLDSAFDHDLFETSLRLEAPLPWRIAASASVSLGLERYAHDNVIDFLTDDGVGSLDPVRRKDLVVETRIGLGRPLTRWSDLELAWRRTDRHSNVDLYAYDRNVLGVTLRLHTF